MQHLASEAGLFPASFTKHFLNAMGENKFQLSISVLYDEKSWRNGVERTIHIAIWSFGQLSLLDFSTYVVNINLYFETPEYFQRTKIYLLLSIFLLLVLKYIKISLIFAEDVTGHLWGTIH